MRTLAILLALSAAGFAQSMQERYEQKQAEPFLKNAAWEQDYDAALKKAAQSNRLVFGYFTRSYEP